MHVHGGLDGSTGFVPSQNGSPGVAAGGWCQVWLTVRLALWDLLKSVLAGSGQASHIGARGVGCRAVGGGVGIGMGRHRELGVGAWWLGGGSADCAVVFKSPFPASDLVERALVVGRVRICRHVGGREGEQVATEHRLLRAQPRRRWAGAEVRAFVSGRLRGSRRLASGLGSGLGSRAGGRSISMHGSSLRSSESVAGMPGAGALGARWPRIRAP